MAWYRDWAEADQEAEFSFLQEVIYGREVDLPMRRSAAYEWYSARSDHRLPCPEWDPK